MMIVGTFLAGIVRPVGEFLKPFAPWLVGAALAVLAAVAIWNTGKGSALRGAEVAAIKFERDAAKRDLAIFKRSNEDAVAFQISEAAREAKRQGALDAIRDAEAKLPQVARDCRLPSADDWRRLQRVR